MPGIGHARPITQEEHDRYESIQTRSLHERVARDYHRRRFNADQLDRSTTIHELAEALAHAIVASSPVGREQSLALTHLEEAVFYHTAAIARGEPDAPRTD